MAGSHAEEGPTSPVNMVSNGAAPPISRVTLMDRVPAVALYIFRLATIGFDPGRDAARIRHRQEHRLVNARDPKAS